MDIGLERHFNKLEEYFGNNIVRVLVAIFLFTLIVCFGSMDYVALVNAS